MSTISIAIVVLAIGAGLTLVLLLASGNARRKLSSSIPPAMRPGYSDEELEGNHLERMMTWGLLLTLFFAVFLPAYWLREPTRGQDKQEGLFARDYATGETLYMANCSECHGTDARGGSAASPYGGDPWPAPSLLNIATRYADSRIIVDVRDHIADTVHRGRPGTPMPSWGAAYGGPMNDFQIDAITNWILANQEGEVAEAAPALNEEGQEVSGEDLYQQNCARCHGTQLEGIVGPSLQGVFERHSPETVLGILQNGINIQGSGMVMPPWQEAYMYEGARFDDDSLSRIIDYLQQAQDPALVVDEPERYQTPNIGEPLSTEEPGSTGDDGADQDADEGADDDESTEV